MSKGASTRRSFATPTSLTGRRLTGAKGSMLNNSTPKTLTPEQIRWNEQVAAKRGKK